MIKYCCLDKGGVALQAESFRAHFPVFRDSVHLCSCSEGALSDRVMVAMSEFMTSWRIHGAPWDAWMEEVDRARQEFANVIHANADDVAVISCASEGAFQVVSEQPFSSARCDIVTTDLEFPSIAHVWLAAEPRGAKVHFVRHQEGMVTLDQYLQQIGETTQLVSVPLVSYANGLRFPVKAIASYAHRYGARVVVDAYQGVGVLPVDVNELDCDYLISGVLKYLLGAPGIAFLWVRPGLTLRNNPSLTGWFGRRNPFAFTPQVLDFADGARRYQTGTPAIPAAFAATAAMSLINELDATTVFRHVERLTTQLQNELLNRGYRLFSPLDASQRGPQIAVWAEDSEHLANFLKDRHIFVSPRGHVVRVSFHFYNDDSDVVNVIDGLEDYRRLYPSRISG